ncbi:MAG: ribosome small subunit-dependent GTPase A [Bacteroidota bacterium]
MPDAPSPPASPEDTLREGLVLRSTGSWYDVRAGGETVQARVRGKFRLEERDVTNPIAVGDRVTLRMEADGTGLITDLLPRHSKLSRRAAGRRAEREHVLVANVDAAWCVQAAKLPSFNPGFVDRFLVMAEAYGIPAGVIINKADLVETDEHAEDLAYWHGLYGSLGYPVLLTSAEHDEGIEDFRLHLEGKTSVVAGPSGVGKSTLLNAVDPSLDLRTGEVSRKTRKGKHTTTFAELLPVAGGYVADTPGIREYGLWDMEPEELSGYFVEMRPYLDDCKFSPCTHDHEPGCAVKAAVEDDEIAPERYLSYLNILASLQSDDVGR